MPSLAARLHATTVSQPPCFAQSRLRACMQRASSAHPQQSAPLEQRAPDMMHVHGSALLAAMCLCSINACLKCSLLQALPELHLLLE